MCDLSTLSEGNKETTMSKINSVTNPKNIIAETSHGSTKVNGEPISLEQNAVGTKSKMDSASPAKKASEKKLDRMSDKLAERGKSTEHRYDADHSIFTK
jgi:hypothetical protein